jgi:hypothetical protein
MFRRILWAALLICAFCLAAFAADAFPHLNGQTFGERAVTIPDAFKGKPAILVITFTRAAQDQARGWTDKLKKESTNIATYQVLELEDVPRLVRGFVRGSIRRSIPKESQDNFILLFEGEDALKKTVGFQNDGEAYVLLLDANGNVQWQEHGAVDEKKLEALREHADRK